MNDLIPVLERKKNIHLKIKLLVLLLQRNLKRALWFEKMQSEVIGVTRNTLPVRWLFINFRKFKYVMKMSEKGNWF